MVGASTSKSAGTLLPSSRRAGSPRGGIKVVQRPLPPSPARLPGPARRAGNQRGRLKVVESRRAPDCLADPDTASRAEPAVAAGGVGRTAFRGTKPSRRGRPAELRRSGLPPQPGPHQAELHEAIEAG